MIRTKYTVEVHRYGDTYRFINDAMHCATGPAVSDHQGHKEWWVLGTKFSEYKFKKRNSRASLDKK